MTAEECHVAEIKVLRMIQNETFFHEGEKRLKTLHSFKDEYGVIRLKTKIVLRKDSEEFRKPIILPSEHEVVKRLIYSIHVKNCHAGVQILLNLLRERYWILNGRKTVRKVVEKCIRCKRYSSKKLESIPGPLPEDRVKDANIFQIIGIDAAGPLILKTAQKSWVIIFTCAVYRAVHLELVTSLSTEAFLMALRRFIARRGRCSVIYCDNGRNLVGAKNLLKSLDWNKLIQYGSINEIEWKFNPPTAPWWGGWWERLIRIMKNLLKKVLGRAELTYEEMTSTLCDCEAVMNSRPLTYMSETEDLVPISPSSFLHDMKEWKVTDIDCIDQKSLNRRVKYRLKLKKQLQERFRSEYLGLLVEKSKSKNMYKIAIGDIVLVGSDHKRIDWPLGQVIELLPGKDGNVRLVRVKTAQSVLLRPIQRLYPLEIRSYSDLPKHTDNSGSKQN